MSSENFHIPDSISHYVPFNNPCTGPLRCQEGENPRFPDNRHMKVARLSALGTGHLYPQEIPLVFISVQGSVDPRAERIKSVKNANDTIGDRTRYLPARGSVPPTTVPPRASKLHVLFNRCFLFASNILWRISVRTLISYSNLYYKFSCKAANYCHRDTFANNKHNKRQIVLHTSGSVLRWKYTLSIMIEFSKINTHI